MSTDPTPSASSSASPESGKPEGASRAPIQVGRSSSGPRPRPTAAPPGPPPKKRDRDAEKYAGASSDAPDEAQLADQVDEDKPLAPTERQRGGDAPKGHRAQVAVPSKRGPLPDDLEAELAAALANLSLEDVLKKDQGSRTGSEIENDTRFLAPVARIHNDDVFFILDGRNEGVASLRNFRDPPELGQQFEVTVLGYDADNGLYNVNIPGGSVSVSDWADIQEGSIVDARITAANTGGLECEVNKIRGFIPASQISTYRVENLSQFVGEKMQCVVTEANPQRKNLVLSRRAMMEREKEAARTETLANLKVGDVREGTVRSLRDFGAFVDIGGVDGMIHISKMSWDRVKHPSEVLTEGQKIKVKVDTIDPETGKIGLSYRDEGEHPWNDIEAKFPLGTTVKGVVTRIANYGAFVKLAPGVEGLLHISELAHHRVVRVQNHVQEGQEVEVKVLEVDKPTQRISLSLKATLQAPEPKDKKPDQPEVEETRREPVIKQKRATLRGGTDRGNGGDAFGLKW
jgi:small subunit ribosomal protein S1